MNLLRFLPTKPRLNKYRGPENPEAVEERQTRSSDKTESRNKIRKNIHKSSNKRQSSQSHAVIEKYRDRVEDLNTTTSKIRAYVSTKERLRESSHDVGVEIGSSDVDEQNVGRKKREKREGIQTYPRYILMRTRRKAVSIR